MSARLMTIGRMARKSGLTPRAIRHYEQVGLIRGLPRTHSNYRVFDDVALQRLRFIARCRALGFSLREIAAFCEVTGNGDWTCVQIEGLVRQHLNSVEAKIGELIEIRKVLVDRLAGCTGEQTPDCEFIRMLEQEDEQRKRETTALHGPERGEVQN